MSDAKGVALISGSAQGLGRSISLHLARDRFDIALNDVSSKCDQLRAVADNIEKIGRRTLLVTADMTVDGEVKGMVQDVVKELSGLDVLVANAGVLELSPLILTELEEWDRVMGVNACSTFLCYKYAAQQMIKQGRGGQIIGASSISGKLGKPLLAAYSASKFAIRGLTQTAALELGPYDIMVNSYAPSLIRTPMTACISYTDGDFAKADLKMIDLWRGHTATRGLKYDGEPEDVASLVSYLALKEAHFITGEYSSSSSC
ncbi:hypothetical protein HD554DRAFT_2167333 [Boletus coccyginus]|nr:hypothetical protein HD554DRAFT_2167333 [Boletus coccyginus]